MIQAGELQAVSRLDNGNMTETAKTPSVGRRLFLVSAGVGFGATLVVCVAVGVFMWWTSRPDPPKPWNTAAITTRFTGSLVQTEDRLIADFEYAVQNHTGRDYELPPKANLFKILPGGKGLQPDESLEWHGATSVPSGQTMSITIRIQYEYNESYPFEDRENFDKLNPFMRIRMSEITGFAVLDRVNRYRIDFPKPPLPKG